MFKSAYLWQERKKKIERKGKLIEINFIVDKISNIVSFYVQMVADLNSFLVELNAQVLTENKWEGNEI
jgi:hypothetical protein